MSGERHYNMHELCDADIVPFIDVLDVTAYEVLQSGKHGIVISAETMDDWKTLSDILEQSKLPEHRSGYFPWHDHYGGVEQHAISVTLRWESPGRVVFDDVGWCSLDWYHRNPPYNRYKFFKFSELFSGVSKANPASYEDFDAMF